MQAPKVLQHMQTAVGSLVSRCQPYSLLSFPTSGPCCAFYSERDLHLALDAMSELLVALSRWCDCSV